MNIWKKRAVGAIAIAFIVMPALALALAQSYDNESAEGSCNDEMNESIVCGSQYSTANYNYSYSSYPTTGYQQQYYYPSTQPTYSNVYSYPYSTYNNSYSYGNQYAYPYNSYNSYVPAAAIPYVQYAQQYQNYSMPSYNYYPSQYSYKYQPCQNNGYGYGYQYPAPAYNYSNCYGSTMTGYSNSAPQVISYPSGTYGPFGTQMCYWSDYPTYAPCGRDPQQWMQDPYTGKWY